MPIGLISLILVSLQKKAKPEKKDLGVISYDAPTLPGEKKGAY